jgi:hypothetical protein
LPAHPPGLVELPARLDAVQSQTLAPDKVRQTGTAA